MTGYKTLNSVNIEDLKREALLSELKRSRVLLHNSQSDQVQQMLIVLHKDTIIDMHRHPVDKSESYHVIEGVLRVFYWDSHESRFWTNDYSCTSDGENDFYGRHSDGIWHMPIPLTEWCVYLETYDGPFVKEHDVEFLV